MHTYKITWPEIRQRLDTFIELDLSSSRVYGVPKGGMILCAFLKHAKVVTNPDTATIILDDIIDSGATQEWYAKRYPLTPFMALYNKSDFTNRGYKWVAFPWETDKPFGEDNVQENIVRTLQYIGEDPKREGLKDTPERIVRSWDELYSGYNADITKIMTVFDADGYDQVILLKDIELFSMCEHHMLPFFGKAHVAYIPNKKIVGISKLARLVDIFARRLQIQERIGQQVTEALMTYLEPKGAACVIEAVHMCMRMRGVSKQESVMVTSSVRGAFMDKGPAREELMQLLKR